MLKKIFEMTKFSVFQGLFLFVFAFSATVVINAQEAKTALPDQQENLIDGTAIKSFSSTLYQDNILRQFLVRNGRIYRRTETNLNLWENITYFVNGTNQVGSGEITGFHVEVYQDNYQRQFLVRGGQIYRRTQTAFGWTAWGNITGDVNGVGQGLITSFSVTVYQDNYQRQFLTRGGVVYRNTETPFGWTGWQDINSVFSGVGSGTITAFNVGVYQDNLQRQFLTRGNRVYRRTEPNWNTWEDVTNVFENVGIKRVTIVNYDPVMSNGQKLSIYKNWQSPAVLAQQYALWINSNQNDVVYVVTRTVNYNQWNQTPVKEDGFQYTEQSYLQCINNHQTCHQPDLANYNLIFQNIDLRNETNTNKVDEVWMFGAPYFGFYESRLVGPNGYWYNAPPIQDQTYNKLIPVMGYSYERDMTLMVHNLGHRTESTMERVYGPWSQTQLIDNWDFFGMNSLQSGLKYSGCGSVHYPPNARFDYDYDNATAIDSYCESFSLNYPAPPSTNSMTLVSSQTWGNPNGDYQLGYLTWWFGKFPYKAGIGPDGKYLNWWQYVNDPNRVFDTDNDTVSQRQSFQFSEENKATACPLYTNHK